MKALVVGYLSLIVLFAITGLIAVYLAIFDVAGMGFEWACVAAVNLIIASFGGIVAPFAIDLLVEP